MDKKKPVGAQMERPGDFLFLLCHKILLYGPRPASPARVYKMHFNIILSTIVKGRMEILLFENVYKGEERGRCEGNLTRSDEKSREFPVCLFFFSPSPPPMQSQISC